MNYKVDIREWVSFLLFTLSWLAVVIAVLYIAAVIFFHDC